MIARRGSSFHSSVPVMRASARGSSLRAAGEEHVTRGGEDAGVSDVVHLELPLRLAGLRIMAITAPLPTRFVQVLIW
jgi:hypothetical protein